MLSRPRTTESSQATSRPMLGHSLLLPVPDWVASNKQLSTQSMHQSLVL